MECPICFEHYNDKRRLPLIYNKCGHTCCISCIHEMESTYNRMGQCPICASKLNGFVPNFALVEASNEIKLLKKKLNQTKRELKRKKQTVRRSPRFIHHNKKLPISSSYYFELFLISNCSPFVLLTWFD